MNRTSSPFPYVAMAIEDFASSQYVDALKRIFVKDFLSSEAFYLALPYIFLQGTVRKWLGNGSSYKTHTAFWKKMMYAYNMLMAVYSFITFAAVAWVLKTEIKLFTEDCGALFRSDIFRYAAYGFFLSKYVEYLDTFFILLRDAEVTWLQWFHHLGAGINMWALVKYENEPCWIFVGFNSFIHTIMYTYYANTVYRIYILPKVMVTSMQIFQFLTGFYILHQYLLNVECYRNDPYRMISSFYLTWVYVGTVLILFCNFFFQTYVMKTGKEDGEAKKPKRA